MIIVVYDPAAGFSSGGGWFIPDGASFISEEFVTDTVSKANFGFIVKYKKGADSPDGKLEFQYNAGDIDEVMTFSSEQSVVTGHPFAAFTTGLAQIRAVQVQDIAAAASENAYTISNVEVTGDTVTGITSGPIPKATSSVSSARALSSKAA